MDNSERYLISIENCQDPDGNLEYEFYYYATREDMVQELSSAIKNKIKRIRQRGPKQSE